MLSAVDDDDEEEGGDHARSSLGSKASPSDDELLSDSEEEDEDQDFSMSDESIGSSSMSPDALAERDAARLAKDEKRLQLDLSRHRQLLIDSQKMNQSLKRCMAWSEEMIAEGRRALEFRVRVSDVKLGGRVLEREDMSSVAEEGEIDDSLTLEERHGLLGRWSPPDVLTPSAVGGPELNEFDSLGIGLDLSETPWPASGTGEQRDSGIHVEEDIPLDELTSRVGRLSIGPEEDMQVQKTTTVSTPSAMI
jgi:hypothetical protein